jgi:hypothetical protein
VKRRGQREDELALIPPPGYFLTLAGVRMPDAGGMVHRPLPAARPRRRLRLLPGLRRGAAGLVVLRLLRGGRIYDLASLTSGGAWRRKLRGEAFRSVREMVAAAVR